MLRQYLSNEDTPTVSDHEVREILDLCLSCKACKSECPSSVDVAKMKGEFMQRYYDRHGIPFRSRLIGDFSRQMKLASIAPRMYNFMVETPALRRLLNRAVGFHPERMMPVLAAQTLSNWYDSDFKKKRQEQPRKVYVFCDEFSQYNDVEIGKKLILLLQKLGYQPEMIPHLESGRTYLSKGLIRRAGEIAVQNVTLFKDVISEATPLIGIEPSAILTFRDEYLDLVPESLQAAAQAIARHTFLFEEWFAKEIDSGNIRSSAFTTKKQVVRLHGHCHQKALSSLTPSLKALSLPENYEVTAIPSGCCGLAGSFGYEQEHYEVSMQVGELVLFPTVRAETDSVVIAAAGTSCRHQIKDGTGRRSLHPVEILYDALLANEPLTKTRIFVHSVLIDA